MYIKAEIPSVRKINVVAYERYKSLYDSDEPLPYKEVVETYLKGHDVAHTVLGKEGRNYLLEFGEYLQKSNVIYPIRGDAIDFMYKHKDELNDFELEWLFTFCIEFVRYCRNNFNKLFGSIFAGTTITRRVEFVRGPILIETSTSVKYNEEDK